jgi:hypothetical protein
LKNGLVIAGVAMFVIGLVALYNGILGMASNFCFAGEDCTTAGGNIIGFPVGLLFIILGSILWTSGGGRSRSATRNPLAQLGFFSIFGISFFGIGAAMFIADQQPGVDHTTNVLTILGIIFGFVGLVSIVVDVVLHVVGSKDAQILATGIRGRATVLAVRDTNVTVNYNPMIALDLKVEIPGQPVFKKTVRQVISRLDVGSYRPGILLSVASDPANPQNIVVDWDNSPIGDANAALDPVTGQPTTVISPSVAAPAGGPTVVLGGQQASSADVAAVLRAAADQISAGGTAAHPEIASAVASSHQWSTTGQTLTSDQIAAILRTAATNASGAQQVSPTDLATMLRNASAAASRAADAAEASARSGSSAVPGVGSGPTGAA